MKLVKNIKEAESWFLENVSGYAVCEMAGIQQRAYSYPEAVKFFERMAKEIELNQDAQG